MSHSRRHRHKRIALTCPACKKKTQANTAALLEAAAQALTACRNAGLKLKVRHGILSCEEGLILPLDDGSFITRTRVYTEFSGSALEASDADD